MATTLKQRLRNKTLCVGSWLSLGNAAIAEIMCNAGFDWLAIDLEHSPTSLETAQQMMSVIDGKGVAPLVRLSSNDAVQIKRVMDSGAHGIIVPMVCDRESVELAAQAMHYPPKGNRGVGLGRAQGYGRNFQAYGQWLAESAVLVVQIEHIDAIENLEAILSHPDVDAYMVGPYDLTASMGIPGQFEHPEYLNVLQKISAVGHQTGTCAGIHIVEPEPEQLQRKIQGGYRFVAYGVDFRMIDHACRVGLEAIDE